MKIAAKFDARIKEALIAGAIALALLLPKLTGPLDQFIWTIQARLSSFEASGDIVFVASDEDLADPRFPDRRQTLARALERLAKTDVERVYVDVVFDRKSTPAVDAELRAAMQRLRDRLYLVQSYDRGIDGENRFHASIPELADGIRQVGKRAYVNFLGYVWNVPRSMSQLGSSLPSLPSSMAGIPLKSEGELPINYGFEMSSIPTLRLADLATNGVAGELPGLDDTLRGRVALVGSADLSQRNTIDIPGRIQVPRSLAQIYAAETLKARLTTHVSGFPILALWFLVLCACLTGPLSGRAGLCAWLLAVALPVFVVAASLLGARVDVSATLAFMAAYALLRAQRNWRRHLSLIDPGTGLPTFAALEASEDVTQTQPTIVVGKIHRLEEVKRTLPKGLHREYIARIIERLRLRSEDSSFYIGDGHYLAWCLEERDLVLVREHLEGLRALLSAPLIVGGELVDVSMTFSVDTSASPNTAKRLAAATAAVEQTSEAYNPISATQIESDEDLLWSISLQARIDAAMENREIYLLFQPKVLVETGDIVGVEALVRWEDPVRGTISPDLFIRQCESAGRMLQLTRYVLREACRAGNELEVLGRIVPIAVNISATLLQDREVVAAVREVLAETRFPAERLTLEITETYRISSFTAAHGIMTELSALGLKISMDDFGVGAASFEALLRLPFGELKIDRLFVSRVIDDVKARAIVKNALQLGKELRIIVVAEGVEDAATLGMLKELGCIVAQGFGIAPPMDADKVLEFHKDHAAAFMGG